MREFIEALMGETPDFINLRFLPGGRQQWFKMRELELAVEAAIDEDRSGSDVYFGVLPRVDRLGSSEAIADSTSVLWADIDAKAFADKAGAFFALSHVALSPQIVVDSGNGYHAYWLLDQDVPFEEAQRVMKGIAISTGGDRVYDKARILRLPGTQNHKACNGHQPLTAKACIPVRILRLDVTGRRHRFSDFVDYADLAYEAERPARPRTGVVDGAWEPSGADAPKIVAERNNALTRLGGIMIARGMALPDVAEALLHENANRCEPPLPEKEVLAIARSLARYAA